MKKILKLRIFYCKFILTTIMMILLYTNPQGSKYEGEHAGYRHEAVIKILIYDGTFSQQGSLDA